MPATGGCGGVSARGGSGTSGAGAGCRTGLFGGLSKAGPGSQAMYGLPARCVHRHAASPGEEPAIRTTAATATQRAELHRAKMRMRTRWRLAGQRHSFRRASLCCHVKQRLTPPRRLATDRNAVEKVTREAVLRYQSEVRKGKIEVIASKPSLTQDDLSLADTRGSPFRCGRSPRIPNALTIPGRAIWSGGAGIAIIVLPLLEAIERIAQHVRLAEQHAALTA